MHLCGKETKREMMIQITQICPTGESLESCYGRIPYMVWLTRESERINRNPKRKTEVIEKKGGVCLVERNYKNYTELVKDMV